MSTPNRMLGETRNDFAPAVDRVWQLDPLSKGTKTTNADRRIAAPYSEATREYFRFDHRGGIAIGYRRVCQSEDRLHNLPARRVVARLLTRPVHRALQHPGR